MLEVEADVAGDKEVQPTITVVVAECATSRPAVVSDVRGLGDVGEPTAAIVAIQAVLPEVRDEQILESVVVEVADTDTLAPSLVRHPALDRTVGEGAIPVVPEERRGRRRVAALEAIDGRAIDQIDIDESVVIEIPERHARARCFDDVVLLRRSRDVFEAG